MKYLDPQNRSGRSSDQVVSDEKIREDRLRASGLRVVRWRWETAGDPRALGSRLASAGLPMSTTLPWRVWGSSGWMPLLERRQDVPKGRRSLQIGQNGATRRRDTPGLQAGRYCGKLV